MNKKDIEEHLLRQFVWTLSRFNLVGFDGMGDRSSVILFHSLTDYYKRSMGKPY